MTDETLSVAQRKKAYNKKYQSDNLEQHAGYVRRYAHKNKEKIIEKNKKQYHKDKTKALVRAKTFYSNEKTGECSDCGMTRKTEFHHLSYQPSIFIEVCKRCHNKRHGRGLYV